MTILNNNQKGQIVLLLTLVILFAILSIGAGLTVVTLREMKMASNIEKSAKAITAADAGMEYALWETNKGDPNNLSPFECGTGSYSVGNAECCFELPGNGIKSIGKYQKIQRAVRFLPDCGEFLKTVGGEDWDVGRSVSPTSDGGYIVTGETDSFGGGGDDDLFLLKFDSGGNLSWAKTVPVAAWDDSGRSVSQTSDGGYIVAGYADIFGSGSSDLVLLKFDSSGNVSWARTAGGAGRDVGRSVSPTSDGGYIVTGETRSYGGAGPGFFFDIFSNIFLVKFNSSGNVTWARTVGEQNCWDEGNSVSQTSDGGYIVTGYTNCFGASLSNLLLLKFDSGGNLSWAKVVEGSVWSSFNEGYSVSQTSDGGYIVSGFTDSFGGGDDFYLLKFDSGGNLSWARTVGGTSYEHGYSVSQTSDGGYIIAGETDSFGVNPNLFLVKFDSSGTFSWARTAGANDGYSYGYSVSQTSDGGYIVTGTTRGFGASWSELLLLKFDSSGNILGCPYISSPSPTVTSPSPTVTSPSPTVFSQPSGESSISRVATSQSVTTDTPCCVPVPGAGGKFEETRP